MSKKKTQEEFEEQVRQKYPHLSVIGKYQTARKPIRMRCNIHDYEYEAYAGAVLKTTTGCKYCGIDHVAECKRKTHKQFLSEIGDVANKVIFLEPYHDMKSKIKVQCVRCGYIYMACPDALKAGNTCKKCAMKYVQQLRIKSNDQFLAEVRRYNPNCDMFDILTPYEKDELPVRCRCKLCGNEWNVMAHNLISKTRASSCPECSMSHGEGMIRQYLKSHNIEYESQKEYTGLCGLRGKNLRYDFFLPAYNLLIEYQGEFHDGSVKYQTYEMVDAQKEHDKRKREYAEKNNIKLLEIWYWDKDKIDEILNKELLASK